MTIHTIISRIVVLATATLLAWHGHSSLAIASVVSYVVLELGYLVASRLVLLHDQRAETASLRALVESCDAATRDLHSLNSANSVAWSASLSDIEKLKTRVDRLDQTVSTFRIGTLRST